LRKILALSQGCKGRFEEAERLSYGIFRDPEGRYVPLPFYTVHGAEHCQAVENFLNEILSTGKDVNKDFIPNSEEAMFLLAGAWLHDIGMMYGIFRGEQVSNLANNPDYCAKLRNEHEVRTTGHILNEWHLECHWSYEEKAILAHICHFHRKKNEIDDFVPAVITGKITREPVRIKVIAALLRIADGCHADRSRVPGNLRALYDSLGMPTDEVCFWGQPELISRVRFQHADGKIVIESLIPNPIDFKRGKFDFEEIIELVRKDIEGELESVQTVLLPYTNTAFKEVVKEVNPLPALDLEAPRRCLGNWPYFLKKPYSATEGAASLAQMLLYELAETQNFGNACLNRIRGMIGEVMQWRPYDVVVFRLRHDIEEILSQEQRPSAIQERVNVYLREFLENIYTHCERMTERALPLVEPHEVLFLYGYSINIVKFLQAIKRSHTVYVVDCRSSEAYLQFEPHEHEQIFEFLRKNGFEAHSIRLIELSQILDDLGRTSTPRKIILGTHSVLKMDNGDHYLLCKKGTKGLCLIGKEGRAEIMAFAETNKFIDIENEEDIESFAVRGFSYQQENSSIGVASRLESSGIRMDVIAKSLIDHLITEEGIH
jgi:translation initiation factor 2B subunit (eIF-2B alpha/beta/delta family)